MSKGQSIVKLAKVLFRLTVKIAGVSCARILKKTDRLQRKYLWDANCSFGKEA